MWSYKNTSKIFFYIYIYIYTPPVTAHVDYLIYNISQEIRLQKYINVDMGIYFCEYK